MIRVVSLLTALLVLPSTLVSASAVAASTPGTYRNPLAPRIPGGGTVDSCADPTVIRGRGHDRGSWFMYCTSDPLNDAGTTGQGDPVLHPVPMMRSTDLTHWDYVGDALPTPPSWAADDALLWAPDVVWSSTYHRYYLTFVVTDTDDAVSGEPGCDDDSAIGVATSTSATGPWTTSDEPVVAPRRGGPGCNFLWTFDPDVLGDSVRDSGLLYFGSYYGGVSAQGISLTADGMRLRGTATRVTRGQSRKPSVGPVDDRRVPRRSSDGALGDDSTRTQVAIDNRYEGTNVVRHHGWYYLFASATNCCNGPLTGYSVFAGRSRHARGPFVDREGNSLLAARVGGTPVVSMNGNRWVGTGHSSAFEDRGGQWWMVYHAVDRRDPYFAGQPGFTRRPVLLDPVDWVHGWPSVRAGRWASDQRMPAPAAQPGQRSAYRPRVVEPDRLGARLRAYSEEFGGRSLDPRWSWVRPPEPSTYAVGQGRLRFDTQAGDLFVDSNTASVLTEPAPHGSYVVQTKVALDVPAAGCCFNYVQAGLVVYGGDDAFVKLVHASIWDTRQTEWASEVPRAPAFGAPRYGNTVVGAPGEETWLRIVRRANPGPDRFTAYTSQDGRRWVRGGTWVNDLPDGARIGLVSMGAAGFHARFDHVRVWRLR